MTDRLSRRVFLGRSATSAMGGFLALSALSATSQYKYASRLGFQAYTVRDLLMTTAASTLQRISSIGYREMELYDPAHAVNLVPLAAANGLHVVGSHLPDLFATDRAWQDWRAAGEPAVPAGFDLDGILAIAQHHSLFLLGYASGAPKSAYSSEADYRAFVRLLDRIGARCRAVGASFIYHNHCREFELIGSRTYFDVIAANSDPEHVAFEVDVCWAAQAGVDPSALISNLGRRVLAIHLKDRSAAVDASPLTEMSTENERRIVAEVGRGVLDIPGILTAAHGARVRNVIVEQDFTPADPVASLAASYSYVRKLGLSYG